MTGAGRQEASRLMNVMGYLEKVSATTNLPSSTWEI